MIDEKGRPCCDKCGKVCLEDLEGWAKWTCPRCKHLNITQKKLTNVDSYANVRFKVI